MILLCQPGNFLNDSLTGFSNDLVAGKRKIIVHTRNEMEPPGPGGDTAEI